MIKNKWFPILKDNGAKKVFCFYHAGGNANMFFKWSRNSELDVIPVELSGHGRRRKEEFSDDVRKIAVEVSKEISMFASTEQFIFWGHSMGALIAFETAYYLEKMNGIKPELLFASARQAPDSSYKGIYRCSQGQQALIEDIKRLGLLSDELLNSKEYLESVIPMTYNDYKINEEYTYKNEIINVPIIAHYGSDDAEVTEERLCEWKRMTTKSFSMQKFSGAHFYVYDEELNYMRELEKIIRACSH